MPQERKRRTLWDRIWPDVSTGDGAINAVNDAFWWAVWIACANAVFAGLAAIGISLVPGITALAFVDAGIFAALAVGLRKRSRLAAWLALIVFVLERIATLSSPSRYSSTLISSTLFIAPAFFSGIRGTEILYKLRREFPEGRSDGSPW